MMILFEIKKIFSKMSSRVALIVLFMILVIICFNALRSPELWYVDREGETHKGITAIRQIKEVKKEKEGLMTEKMIAGVIEKNNEIKDSREYNSSDVTKQNIAFSRGQGISDIRDLLTISFCGFGDYDYYMADRLKPDDAGRFYENRTVSLREYLKEGMGEVLYTDDEKEYIVSKFEELNRPFYYDYASGWKVALEMSPMIQILMSFVLVFLVSGIFPSEYSLKTDSVLFSSKYGRGKAVRSKIWAGVLCVTAIYVIVMMIYTIVLLGIIGADGDTCVIQTDWSLWNSMYDITFIQAYSLMLICGYIGSIFMALFTMFISVNVKSAVISVVIPFVILFLPLYLPDTMPAAIEKILGLFPDNILQVYMGFDEFSIYGFAGHMTGALYFLPFVYLLFSIVMIPAVYSIYRKTAI